MSKQVVKTVNAPAPIGPYNQAIKANGFVFLSGQVAFDPVTGALVQDNIAAETHQVMKNIEAVLKEVCYIEHSEGSKDVISDKLQVTSYKLRVTGYKKNVYLTTLGSAG